MPYPRNPRRPLGGIVASSDVVRRWERITGKRQPGADCPDYFSFYYRAVEAATRLTRQGAVNDYWYSRACQDTPEAREIAWASGRESEQAISDDRQALAWGR